MNRRGGRGRRERRGGLSISGLRGLLSRPDEPWPERPEPPPPTEAESGSEAGAGSGSEAGAGSGASGWSAEREPSARRSGRAAAALAPAYQYWRRRPALRWASLTVAVLLVAGIWVGYSLTHQGQQITAYFSQTIGVYTRVRRADPRGAGRHGGRRAARRAARSRSP